MKNSGNWTQKSVKKGTSANKIKICGPRPINGTNPPCHCPDQTSNLQRYYIPLLPIKYNIIHLMKESSDGRCEVLCGADLLCKDLEAAHITVKTELSGQIILTYRTFDAVFIY